MLDTTEPNERAVKGGNNPPAHVTFMEHAESLVELAEGLGEITTDAQANAVGELAGEAKKAAKDAEAARKKEKQPHLDAGKAVDANFKPVTERFNRVADVTRSLLTPWLAAKREAEQAAARAAAEIARKADEEARRAQAEADPTDIEQVEKAAAAQAEAKAAKQDAKNAQSKPATVKGVQYRTKRTAEMTDRKALLTHIAKTDPESMTAFGQEWLLRAVRGGATEIPGAEITEMKEAV